MSEGYGEFHEGDTVERKGKLYTLHKIHWTTHPPSVDIKDRETGEIIDTEFSRLTKVSDSDVGGSSSPSAGKPATSSSPAPSSSSSSSCASASAAPTTTTASVRCEPVRWACPICTFHNRMDQVSCEMCGSRKESDAMLIYPDIFTDGRSGSATSMKDSSLLEGHHERDEEEYEHHRVEPEERDAAAVEPPQHLCCPITAELFEDPVLSLKSGFTFEKSAILAHLENSDFDPLTRQFMTHHDLVPNRSMRDAIDHWKSTHLGKG